MQPGHHDARRLGRGAQRRCSQASRGPCVFRCPSDFLANGRRLREHCTQIAARPRNPSAASPSSRRLSPSGFGSVIAIGSHLRHQPMTASTLKEQSCHAVEQRRSLERRNLQSRRPCVDDPVLVWLANHWMARARPPRPAEPITVRSRIRSGGGRGVGRSGSRRRHGRQRPGLRRLFR